MKSIKTEMIVACGSPGDLLHNIYDPLSANLWCHYIGKTINFLTNKVYKFRLFDIVEFPGAKMMTDEEVAW